MVRLPHLLPWLLYTLPSAVWRVAWSASPATWWQLWTSRVNERTNSPARARRSTSKTIRQTTESRRCNYMAVQAVDGHALTSTRCRPKGTFSLAFSVISAAMWIITLVVSSGKPNACIGLMSVRPSVRLSVTYFSNVNGARCEYSTWLAREQHATRPACPGITCILMSRVNSWYVNRSDFTARRYATLYMLSSCVRLFVSPFVCLSVRHEPVLYQNG